METVQPIRDLDKLQTMYQIAIAHDKKKGSYEVSWELLLLVGFNTEGMGGCRRECERRNGSSSRSVLCSSCF